MTPTGSASPIQSVARAFRAGRKTCKDGSRYHTSEILLYGRYNKTNCPLFRPQNEGSSGRSLTSEPRSMTSRSNEHRSMTSRSNRSRQEQGMRLNPASQVGGTHWVRGRGLLVSRGSARQVERQDMAAAKLSPRDPMSSWEEDVLASPRGLVSSKQDRADMANLLPQPLPGKPNPRKLIERHMLEYCKLDTLALVKLVDFFQKSCVNKSLVEQIG